MLGMVGVLIYGLVYGGAWADDHEKENTNRADSMTIGMNYYFDKNGVMRHTMNGKKYTTQEMDSTDIFGHKQFKSQMDEHDRKIREIEKYYKEEYYGVEIGERYSGITTHVFKTKKEAEEFYNVYKENGEKVSFSRKWSEALLNDGYFKSTANFIFHFEREEKEA